MRPKRLLCIVLLYYWLLCKNTAMWLKNYSLTVSNISTKHIDYCNLWLLSTPHWPKSICQLFEVCRVNLPRNKSSLTDVAETTDSIEKQSRNQVMNRLSSTQHSGPQWNIHLYWVTKMSSANCSHLKSSSLVFIG